MGSNLQFVWHWQIRHMSALHAAHHIEGMTALSHASIGTVYSLSCMYMVKATAFVSALKAVMQVYVGNRDSKLSRCCMCKISQIMLGRR